jgi:hypothetical protein
MNKTQITYSRYPRASKKPERDLADVAREVIRRSFFGTLPHTVLTDAHAFFLMQPAQDTMNGIIEHLAERYPQMEAKAYVYTNLRGRRLVEYDKEQGVYVWNSLLWAEIKNQIWELVNLVNHG